MTQETLLSLDGVVVEFRTEHGTVRAIDHVSFDVAKGERVGLVGESGSGKSVLALAIMGLIRPPGHVVGGEVSFAGTPLSTMSQSALTRIRGRRIALIPQDASLALTPVLTVGDQMREMVRRHLDLDRDATSSRCESTLRRVGLPDPGRILRSYASELSGGMKQRVAIAMALLCEPELLIADDPTSAVDVTIQAQILRELRELSEGLGLAVLFVTHDLRVVSSLCSRIVVLYAGQIAEMGASDAILRRPRHPYAVALVRCSPSVGDRLATLPTVPGAAPDTFEEIPGCRFHPRCPRAIARCSVERPSLEGDLDHAYACWNPQP
jgi:peptide/nickel transport system ATP-binding protein